VIRTFHPKAIAKLEEGFDGGQPRWSMGYSRQAGGDWIEDVADVLPMSVIGDIIGIPMYDRPEIFDTFDRILSPIRRTRS